MYDLQITAHHLSSSASTAGCTRRSSRASHALSVCRLVSPCRMYELEESPTGFRCMPAFCRALSRSSRSTIPSMWGSRCSVVCPGALMSERAHFSLPGGLKNIIAARRLSRTIWIALRREKRAFLNPLFGTGCSRTPTRGGSAIIVGGAAARVSLARVFKSTSLSAYCFGTSTARRQVLRSPIACLHAQRSEQLELTALPSRVASFAS